MDIFCKGGASAGLFLVYHHEILGPYFGDGAGNEWPHIPLHKKPSTLENDFNHLLMNITFSMSDGKLQNVSLLDLPAFGSTIETLKIGLKKQFLWPLKTNFAILKNNQGVNMSKILMSYKSLFEDWSFYMEHLDKDNYANFFTPQMKNNSLLDFTGIIKADMKTFLITIAGKFVDFKSI